MRIASSMIAIGLTSVATHAQAQLLPAPTALHGYAGHIHKFSEPANHPHTVRVSAGAEHYAWQEGPGLPWQIRFVDCYTGGLEDVDSTDIGAGSLVFTSTTDSHFVIQLNEPSIYSIFEITGPSLIPIEPLDRAAQMASDNIFAADRSGLSSSIRVIELTISSTTVLLHYVDGDAHHDTFNLAEILQLAGVVSSDITKALDLRLWGDNAVAVLASAQHHFIIHINVQTGQITLLDKFERSHYTFADVNEHHIFYSGPECTAGGGCPPLLGRQGSERRSLFIWDFSGHPVQLFASGVDPVAAPRIGNNAVYLVGLQDPSADKTPLWRWSMDQLPQNDSIVADFFNDDNTFSDYVAPWGAVAPIVHDVAIRRSEPEGTTVVLNYLSNSFYGIKASCDIDQ